MSLPLPARPSLEWLRKTAKDRLTRLRRTQPDAQLAAAQLAVARDYGFSSWRALKAHVDRASKTPPLAEEVVAELLRRVGAGAVDEVRAQLEADPALVNAVGPHPFWGGRPQALHVAIETKRRPMIDLLLDRGADVNGSNDAYDRWSPLMVAINRGDPDVREALLARGARVGLIEALLLGDDLRMEALLEAHGLPTAVPNGGSVLAFARTPRAIDRLLALGARPEAKDRWGSTPIDALSRLGARGHALVRHMTARGVSASPADYARLGDAAALQRLTTADPAVATLDSVLLGAVELRHHALVEWLLAHGASANARAASGSRQTALHSAAWNGDVPMVALLVAAGADVEARDEQYRATPRGWAETAITVSNNPACADVVAWLDAHAE